MNNCCGLITSNYISSVRINNYFYPLLYECIQEHLNNGYNKAILGDDYFDDFDTVNRFHYLLIILNQIDTEYQIYISEVRSDVEKQTKKKELIEKYNLSCIVEHFNCLGCNISFVYDVFCTDEYPTLNDSYYLCPGSTLHDIDTNGDLEWCLDNTFETLLPNDTEIEEQKYYARLHSSLCEYTLYKEVNVYLCSESHMNMVITGPTEICIGSLITLEASDNSGEYTENKCYNYLWTTDNTGASPIVETGLKFVFKPSNVGPQVIYFRWESLCEAGEYAVHQFNVYPISYPSITVDSYVCCVNEPVVITTDAGYSDYSWQIQGNYTIVSMVDETLVIMFISPGEHIVGVTYEKNGCTSHQSSVVMTAMVAPIIDAGNDMEICILDGYVLLSGQSNTTNIIWTHNGNGQLINDTSLQPAYIPDESDAGNTVSFVLYTTGGCLVTDTVNVEINDYPRAGILSTEDSLYVCNGLNYPTLSLHGQSGIIKEWQKSVSPYTSWQAIPGVVAAYYTPNNIETTKYRVVMSNATCDDVYSNEIIVVCVSLPEGPEAEVEQFFCSVSMPLVGDIIVTGSDLLFYDSKSNLVPLSTEMKDGDTYLITQSLGNCESNPVTVNITIYDKPAISDLVTYSICENETTFDIPLENITGTIDSYTIEWSNDALMVGLINTTGDVDGETITVQLKSGITPGIYSGILILHNTDNNDNIVCSSDEYRFTLRIYSNPVMQIEDYAWVSVAEGKAIVPVIDNGVVSTYDIIFTDAGNITDGFRNITGEVYEPSSITLDIPTIKYDEEHSYLLYMTIIMYSENGCSSTMDVIIQLTDIV